MSEIQASYNKLLAERQPHLDALNAVRNERDAGMKSGELTVKREHELAIEIKRLSAIVYPMDVQIAALARALPGTKSLQAKA
jgi:hypothetical protein